MHRIVFKTVIPLIVNQDHIKDVDTMHNARDLL